MHSNIDAFLSSWAHVRRQLTNDFVRGVPEALFDTSPHPRFASFDKQTRHLICVQGVYLHGLRERVCDFSTKHSHYKGGLDRESLLRGLAEKDEELETLLAQIDRDGADRFAIDWFGQKMGLVRYLQVFVQHESIHHGQWSFYAALGGFETPRSWQLNWGL